MNLFMIIFISTESQYQQESCDVSESMHLSNSQKLAKRTPNMHIKLELRVPSATMHMAHTVPPAIKTRREH